MQNQRGNVNLSTSQGQQTLIALQCESNVAMLTQYLFFTKCGELSQKTAYRYDKVVIKTIVDVHLCWYTMATS